MAYDYFYGAQGEHFRYYQIPAIMLEHAHYRELSAQAKLLYSVLLNLVSLSRKNHWIEQDTNRVYIICPQKEMADRLGCSLRSVTKIIRELTEFGLVERKKQGQGKPELIFVKNFASGDIEEELVTSEGEPSYHDTCREDETVTDYPEEMEADSLEIEKENTCGARNHAAFSDTQNLRVKTRKSCVSRDAKIACQDAQNLHVNYPDKNYINKIIYNHPSINPERRIQREDEIGLDREHPANIDGGSTGRMSVNSQKRREDVRQEVCEQIGYAALVHDLPWDREEIDALVELMTDLMSSHKPTVQIAGELLETKSVRQRLRQVDMECVKYILDCLQKNTSRIYNIRQYLIATLYNAPVTISHFYQAQVNHDLYHQAWRETEEVLDGR